MSSKTKVYKTENIGKASSAFVNGDFLNQYSMDINGNEWKWIDDGNGSGFWQQTRTGGNQHVSPREARITQHHDRIYVGNPASIQVRTWAMGVSRVRVTVYGNEVAAGSQKPSLRVAFNRSATSAPVALADRDADHADVLYKVVELGRPRLFEFEVPDQRIYTVAFQTNAGTISEIIFEGERDEN